MVKKLPRKRLRSKASTKTGVTFDAVCALARKLPESIESTSYGTRSLNVGKTLFARLKEDGQTMVLKMDLVSRDYVLRDQPAVFFLTDHYRDYPYVLVRLGAVTVDQMRELLDDAWRLAAPKKLIAARDAGAQ